MQTPEIKWLRLEQKTLSDVSDPVLGKIFGFFSPQEREVYKVVTHKLNKIIKGPFIWEGGLRKRPEQDLRSDEKIRKESPEYCWPGFWPNLSGSEAIAFYNKVLKIFPGDPDAASGKAFWEIMATPKPTNLSGQRESKDRTQIAEPILEILGNNPKNANCYYYLGRLTQEGYIKLRPDDFPKVEVPPIRHDGSSKHDALCMYWAARTHQPNHLMANYFVGIGSEEGGYVLTNKTDAAESYHRVIARDPGNAGDEPF